jgi:hypothetical protein
MKNAALVLGIIGGILALIVGFSINGWFTFAEWFNAEVNDVIDPNENEQRLRAVGLIAPILAIAGGAMSVLRPFIGAGLMLFAAAGIIWGLGFGLFTMFPVALCLLGGLLGLAGAFTREPGGMDSHRRPPGS